MLCSAMECGVFNARFQGEGRGFAGDEILMQKVKYLLRRGVVVMTMVMLMFISVSLAVLLAKYSNAGYIVAWPALGDFVLPLCFVLLAQIFRNRVCAVIAVLLAFVNVILRIATFIIRRETFMPFGLDTLILLWEHADHKGFQAVLGRYYYLWLFPLLAVALGVMIFFCTRAWYESRKRRRVIPNSWITVFALLFAVSIFSSTFYVCTTASEKEPDQYSMALVRPTPVIVADIAGGIVDMAMSSMSECGFFPEDLPADSAELLEKHHIFNRKPQGCEVSREPSAYDRVIIIAVESLELAFLRSFNPAMPEGVTPYLDRLCRENISFKNCFTAAQPTSWGLTALMMSRLDYRRELKNPGNPSLFSISGRLGFEGFYFSPVSGYFGRNRETYMRLWGGEINNYFFSEDWRSRFNAKSRHTWGISDRELFGSVLSVLEKEDCPKQFIALISTIDIHPPYTRVIDGKCKKEFNSPFLDSLHSFDHHLEYFLSRLMKNPELYNERTLIVLTADHSATHGENYLKRKDFNPERIPLVFITPNRRPLEGLDVEKYCSSIDLTPTLVRLIGGKTPRTFMGRDLREKKDCAIAWTSGDRIFFYDRSREEPLIVQLDGTGNADEPDAFRKMVADYFRLYYRK